jgi:hypothetical protein
MKKQIEVAKQNNLLKKDSLRRVISVANLYEIKFFLQMQII